MDDMSRLITISEVSKAFQISTRTLRYYEQIGLLRSRKKEDYAYRAYDMETVRRLQQILFLRKLRIPLKQIQSLFEDAGKAHAIALLQQNLSSLNMEITALSTVCGILSALLSHFKKAADMQAALAALSDRETLKAVEALTHSKLYFQEERSMDDLNKASELLETLKDVRILMLPPFTVASSHFIGENPEETAGGPISSFVRSAKLYEIKPDARVFGFNHPNPSPDKAHYGYETWVTIPEDLDVPAPLVKKQFPGGLYAAHAIAFGDFHEWALLSQWAQENGKYEPNYSPLGEEIMSGCLEEHLNWVYADYLGWPEESLSGQLDLLLPIRHKKRP